MIAPNKQNLIRFKKQIKTFKSGHKLLTEKRNGLIKLFLDMAREGKELELQLSSELGTVVRSYIASLTYISVQDLENALPQIPVSSLQTKKKRISGVYVENLGIEIKPPKRDHLRKNISQPLERFAEYFPILLKVSQLRINCKRIGAEITKTNRQISNIEKKIEEADATIKYIQEFLTDLENMNKATLNRIFN